MPPPLLNTHSTILCHHGGIVSHVPNGYTSYRVDGQLPMKMSDTYLITGCPNSGFYSAPCQRVDWLVGSTMLIIKGSPALTLTSTGICISGNGSVSGPAIITRAQTAQLEPTELTIIND